MSCSQQIKVPASGGSPFSLKHPLTISEDRVQVLLGDMSFSIHGSVTGETIQSSLQYHKLGVHEKSVAREIAKGIMCMLCISKRFFVSGISQEICGHSPPE